EEYASYVEDRAEVREQKSKVTAFAAKLAAARKAGDAEARANLQAEQDVEQKKLDEMNAESGAQIMRPIERLGISPGAQFLQTMTLDSPTDAELGLLLDALKRFASSCRLGGLESIGFGQIKASWVIEEIDPTNLQKERIGTVQISDCEFDADLSHPTLRRAIDAWSAYVSAPEKIALTPAALEQVIAAR
ncbi:MAG: hypothetical protein KDJ12_04200, partial [Hyphomicrobiales bacterium]|nr:hypothetical protein [Hyphomicrobiales bacterium]